MRFAFLALLAFGCSNGPVTYATPPDGGGGADVIDAGAVPPGVGVGGACDDTNRCRVGLACTDGKCVPGHTQGDGAPCVISGECKDGDYCGADRKCDPAGKGGDGDGCTSDADCSPGLRCDVVGFTTQCKPEGSGDVGGACTTSADCFGGLTCVNKICASLPPTPGVPPIGVPGWKGVDCTDDPAPVKAYFRVPRGTDDGDFFRLPFPNDVRTKNGHPALSGFPTPGADLLGYDVVDRYARDVEANADGFSAYPTVTFRFSGGIDFDSLKAAGVIRWIDVTSGGTYDELAFGWSATTARNQYVCPNAVSARTAQGAPLKPGSTYAVVISTGAKIPGGGPIARAEDFVAVLGAAAPADPALAGAWNAYKPLRDWATTKSESLDAVLVAAVFTVAHAPSAAQKIAAAVQAAAAPTAASWIRCGDAASPCPQATGDRSCGSADPAFDELHAMVTLPIFQRGTAPYLTPNDGGDVGTDPSVQRTEAVCMSLTVPKGVPMPAGGWPLVIYAHGTGGSFRSQVTEGVAARLAAIDDGAGGKLYAAVLGIDQVEHGPRRGASTASPDQLFYNFANPGASRGNPLQGAADQMALVRFAQALDLALAQSPTGAEIKFGPIAFWGHSQGATAGSVALPYVTGPLGAVLSGQGASLIDALLGKRNPVDIADAVPLVLEDPNVNSSHPVLSLLQNAIDPADPLNHARAMVAAPAPKHVFMPYGQKDTFAPPATQAAYALAAGLGVALTAPSGQPPDPIGSLPELAIPVSGNLVVAGKPYTAVVREYGPNGYDGHFVAFREATCEADVAHFLADALAGKVPKAAR
jgi:hypothetical protein